MPAGPPVTVTFLRWSLLRAVFHRGYVLASSLYFVVTAHLAGSQLLVLATVMSITLLVSDIPAGVWSDGFSRKWPLVIGHALLAAGMVLTGLVTTFALLIVTQILWGLGWAFSTGADVAWVTDEFDRPDLIAQLLTARARWELMGGGIGMIAFGVLGWATSLGTAIVISGIAMAAVGLYVAFRFAEDKFAPLIRSRWMGAISIFNRGLRLSRGDRQVWWVLVATFVVNAAAMISWVFPRQLVDKGFPSNPVLWYTGLGVLSFGVGVLALQLVEARIHRVGVARWAYALACLAGVMGLLVLAFAPNALIASIGIMVASGVCFTVTRTVSVIWVNSRTPSEIRTTMHSFLSQAESLGEVIGGAALAGLARLSGNVPTIVASAALVGVAGVVVLRSRSDRLPRSPATGR